MCCLIIFSARVPLSFFPRISQLLALSPPSQSLIGIGVFFSHGSHAFSCRLKFFPPRDLFVSEVGAVKGEFFLSACVTSREIVVSFPSLSRRTFFSLSSFY